MLTQALVQYADTYLPEVIENLAFEPTDYEFDPDGWILYRTTPWDVPDDPYIYIPDQFYVSNAYPNPFNSMTRLNLYLPGSSFIEADVYNILGEKIAKLSGGYRNSGVYPLSWQPESDLSSGVYFITVSSKSGVTTRRVTLLK